MIKVYEMIEKLNRLKGEAAAWGVFGAFAVDEDRIAGDFALDLVVQVSHAFPQG